MCDHVKCVRLMRARMCKIIGVVLFKGLKTGHGRCEAVERQYLNTSHVSISEASCRKDNRHHCVFQCVCPCNHVCVNDIKRAGSPT